MRHSFLIGKESCDVSGEDNRTGMKGEISMPAQAKDVVKELKDNRLDKDDTSFTLVNWYDIKWGPTLGIFFPYSTALLAFPFLSFVHHQV